jgi:DNA-binding CsgD family transcriptional regulator
VRAANSPDWDDVFMAAALEPHRWMESLDLMASRTGASHGQLIGIGGARDVPFNLITNADGWPMDELVEAGGYGADVNFRVAANASSLMRGHYDPVLHEDHYDSVTPGLASRSYVDFCDAIDIPHGCQTNLVLDGVELIGLATLRKRREGRTTPAQRRTFARAAAAARRAVRLQERLEGQQAMLLAGAFDALALTAFIIDARGQLLAHTAAADERLRAGDVYLRDRVPDAPGMPWPLSRAIAALTADDGVAHVQLRIDLPAGRTPLFLEGFRLPPRPWSLGRLPHAVLVARQPRRDRAGVMAFLAAIYGLTSAEADIAIRLFEGKPRGEIAAERGVTVETLRGQIKSLYAKTGADGEAALVRVLAVILA